MQILMHVLPHSRWSKALEGVGHAVGPHAGIIGSEGECKHSATARPLNASDFNTYPPLTKG